MESTQPFSFSIESMMTGTTFPENYVRYFIDDQEINYAQVVSDLYPDSTACDDCFDNGYMRPARFIVSGKYFDWDGVLRPLDKRHVCGQHVMDEVENFRDLGK